MASATASGVSAPPSGGSARAAASRALRAIRASPPLRRTMASRASGWRTIPRPPRPRSGVLEGPPDQGPHVLVREGLQAEDAQAGAQGGDDVEVGVLGGGADQDHRPVLDVREEGILLRLGPAVHLVHQQNRALPHLATLPRLVDHPAQVGDAVGDGAQGGEVGAGAPGDQPGQGGLARPRRPPQDHRAQPVLLDRPAQGLAGAHQVGLAGVLLQRAGAEAHGEGAVRIARPPGGAGGRVVREQGGLERRSRRPAAAVVLRCSHFVV